MDEFIKKAFERANVESAEAEDAEKAWKESGMPAMLAAESMIGSERFVPLVRALSISRTEDVFFQVCLIYFFAGFSRGRDSL